MTGSPATVVEQVLAAASGSATVVAVAASDHSSVSKLVAALPRDGLARRFGATLPQMEEMRAAFAELLGDPLIKRMRFGTQNMYFLRQRKIYGVC